MARGPAMPRRSASTPSVARWSSRTVTTGSRSTSAGTVNRRTIVASGSDRQRSVGRVRSRVNTYDGAMSPSVGDAGRLDHLHRRIQSDIDLGEAHSRQRRPLVVRVGHHDRVDRDRDGRGTVRRGDVDALALGCERSLVEGDRRSAPGRSRRSSRHRGAGQRPPRQAGATSRDRSARPRRGGSAHPRPAPGQPPATPWRDRRRRPSRHGPPADRRTAHRTRSLAPAPGPLGRRRSSLRRTARTAPAARRRGRSGARRGTAGRRPR